jgi:hypothetical protein
MGGNSMKNANSNPETLDRSRVYPLSAPRPKDGTCQG